MRIRGKVIRLWGRSSIGDCANAEIEVSRIELRKMLIKADIDNEWEKWKENWSIKPQEYCECPHGGDLTIRKGQAINECSFCHKPFQPIKPSKKIEELRGIKGVKVEHNEVIVVIWNKINELVREMNKK